MGRGKPARRGLGGQGHSPLRRGHPGERPRSRERFGSRLSIRFQRPAGAFAVRAPASAGRGTRVLSHGSGSCAEPGQSQRHPCPRHNTARGPRTAPAADGGAPTARGRRGLRAAPAAPPGPGHLPAPAAGPRKVRAWRGGGLCICGGRWRKPDAEGMVDLVLANGLEGATERVLRDFPGIGLISTPAADKCKDPRFIATDQFLKGGQGAGLALPRQLLVRQRWPFGVHARTPRSLRVRTLFGPPHAPPRPSAWPPPRPPTGSAGPPHWRLPA